MMLENKSRHTKISDAFDFLVYQIVGNTSLCNTQRTNIVALINHNKVPCSTTQNLPVKWRNAIFRLLSDTFRGPRLQHRHESTHAQQSNQRAEHTREVLKCVIHCLETSILSLLQYPCANNPNSSFNTSDRWQL